MSYEDALEEVKRITDKRCNNLADTVKCLKEILPIVDEAIKSMGREDARTVQIATIAANCITDSTVRCINATTKRFTTIISSGAESFDEAANAYRKILEVATHVFEYLDRMPLSDSFRDERLTPQRHKLKRLNDEIRAIEDRRLRQDTVQKPERPSETAPETVEKDAEREIDRRKNPTAKIVIFCIGAIALITVILLLVDFYNEKTALKAIRDSYTEESIMAYLTDRGNTHYLKEAADLYLERMDSILLSPNLMKKPTQYPALVRMDNFSREKNLSQNIASIIRDRVKARSDSLYKIAAEINTIEAWQKFQSQAPSGNYRDSNEKLDSLESIAWSKESTAWQAATSIDDKDAYTRYLREYGIGAHAKEAEGKLVDIEVLSYKNRASHYIKEIGRVADYIDGESSVYIFNNTGKDIQFLFSGPSSCRMSIADGGQNSVKLADGEYRVLVLFDDQHKGRFSFTQKFESGLYSSTISFSDPD